MPQTETKAYSPGAERAALRICNESPGWSDWIAEIISRETCDREMLEALKELVNAEWMVSPDWSGGAKRNAVIAKAEALIAKVEGR